ncbi:MAG: hypothetical protein ACYCU7_18895 [Acidimicrobiales bacterium]
MARADQLQACFELFSGATATIPADVYQVRQKTFPYGTWALPAVQTIVRGELFDRQSALLPAMYLLVPEARERRAMTAWKFIDYTVAVYLEAQIAGKSLSGQGGAQAVVAFYQAMDQIAALIRGNTSNEKPKSLITPSYPQGASIRFGEQSESIEEHLRDENTLLIVAKFSIQSTEQVQA